MQVASLAVLLFGAGLVGYFGMDIAIRVRGWLDGKRRW